MLNYAGNYTFALLNGFDILQIKRKIKKIRETKFLLLMSLIFFVLLYDVEAWTLLRPDTAALEVIERKTLFR